MAFWRVTTVAINIGDGSRPTAQKTRVGMVMTALGDAGGGIIAILFKGGLFDPLFICAGLSLFAGLLLTVYMVDVPKDDQVAENKDDGENDEAGDAAGAPKELDRSALRNIIGGALVDNIGSAGLQMCISPVMIDAFGPRLTGEKGQMTMSEYQWISTLVALAIIPGLAASLPAFKKYGYAGSCVFGNLITAAATAALLYIAKPVLDDPGMSSASTLFIVFAIFLYVSYPITVISQLTRAPCWRPSRP